MPKSIASNQLSLQPCNPATLQPLTLWLLSSYHTGSHKAWATGYARHSRHNVHLLTMPGRFWKWRMQGGAIELAHLARQQLAIGPPPHAILATDMVNLPTWLGLMRHELPADVPVILYMHENQLTYPSRPGEKPDLTYPMLNWLSQLAADQIVFNSRYNYQSWFDAVPNLLKHYPDYNHLNLVEEVRLRSQVLPVGIACDVLMPVESSSTGSENGGLSLSKSTQAEPPLILWNQRWEYDKRPDLFFALLYKLHEAGVPFRLAVAGENFRNVPDEFVEAQERLGKAIIHWGYLPTYADYVALLQQADLVISTAEHEFFGISILEAITAGAFPLLPNRLSYPELIPEALHPACLYEDETMLFEMARQRLLQSRPAPPSLQEHVERSFGWVQVAEMYDISICGKVCVGKRAPS